MTKMYLLVMYRYGDKDGHAYYLGVSKNKSIAYIRGKIENQYRGGKYDPTVYEVEINENKPKILLQQYDQIAPHRDEHNIYVTIMNEDEEKKLQQRKRTHIKMRELEAEDYIEISDQDVVDHMYLLPHYFTEEEQSYLKDRYEQIVRKKYQKQ